MIRHVAFRPAAPADTPVAAELLRASGPEAVAFGYGEGAAQDGGFVAFAFTDGRGLFGWRNHAVLTVDGEVAGLVAGYGLVDHLRLSAEHATMLWRHYGRQQFLPVLGRNLQLRSLMPAPDRREHYVAHVAVRPELRGQGLGRAIVDYQIALARRSGRRAVVLDVSVCNPRARALYERCGMTPGQVNRFSGPAGVVPDTVRMALQLSP